MVDEWGVEEGKVMGDNKADPKTITLNYEVAEEGAEPLKQELKFVAKNDDL